MFLIVTIVNVYLIQHNVIKFVICLLPVVCDVMSMVFSVVCDVMSMVFSEYYTFCSFLH